MQEIIIIGAGGHAKVIADILSASGNPPQGFLDDKVCGSVLKWPILGQVNDAEAKFLQAHFLLGIGDNRVREILDHHLQVRWYTAVHPTAAVAMEVVIGEGTVVMAQAAINPAAQIGRHCIINTGAVIEHDCVLDDYVHISPKAALCGTVRVGKRTHIGAGAVVKNNVSICEDCIIGAGAAVVCNLTEPGTYVGVPVKKIK